MAAVAFASDVGSQDGRPAPVRTNQDEDPSVQLNRCRIWEKLRKGELHSITRENVEELVAILDNNDMGEITKEDLKELQTVPDLELTDEDIEEIAKDCDKDQSGRISVEELHKALTTGSISFKKVLEALGKKRDRRKPTECEREDLVKFLHEEYEVSSALWALPTTFVTLAVYMVLVHFHIRVDTAYEMQHAILNEIEGEGSAVVGNFLRASYVHDIETYWAWMNSSFIAATFKNDLTYYPYPGRFASYNRMIGGVRLDKYYTAPEQCQQASRLFLQYDNFYGPGYCHKLGQEMVDHKWLLYHFAQDYLQEELDSLQSVRWLDQNVTSARHSALFYNAHLNAFTSYQLAFTFRADGLVTVHPIMETFLADPYFDKWIVAMDAIFMLLLLRVFWSEVKELIPACMNGFDGFIEYMGFWNFIDWVNLSFGVACLTVWALVCTTVGGGLQDAIAALPTEPLDAAVIRDGFLTNVTAFESIAGNSIDGYTSKLEEVLTTAADIENLHSLLRWILVFYSMSLMLKFFKAFRANPRLNIVIDTITESWVDICHFGLVFAVIFIVFAIMGQLAFGARIAQFSTLRDSLMMCWRILMGEFDVDEMQKVSSFLASLWFVLFTGLVLLILLNMLLAIIMDTYTGVKSKKASPRTIWAQWREAIRTVRETRGHLPLWNLICEFEDDGMPAHPGKHVTLRSLRRAFEKEKMTRHNAEYLVRKTVDYIKEKEGESELTMSDAIRLLGQLKTQVWKASDNSTEAVGLLRKMDQAPQQARLDAILAGEDPDAIKTVSNAFGNNIAKGVPFGGPRAPNSGSNLQLPAAACGGGGGGWQASTLSRAGNSNNFSHLPASQACLTAPAGNLQRRMSGGGFGDGVVTDGFRGMDHGMGMMQHPNMINPMLMMGGGEDLGLAEMGMMINGLHRVLEEQRRHTQEHDDWLDKRISAMERRCDTVEQVGERLYRLLNNLDPEGLARMPEKVDHILKEQRRQMESMYDGTGSEIPSGTPMGLSVARRGPRSSALEASPQRLESVEAKLTQLGEQVTQLVSHAEEAAEMRRILWRIDLNLRQMKQEPGSAGPTSPAQTGVVRMSGAAAAPRRSDHT
mmetsp:Transcript_13404/g.31474  ORF Transcript_13404/g.31474 Transcript_13404/m.31474 type:complete len:1091 (-) Transcript_13404:315-3587(-)|eukprot:CAMPEP_0178441922 /NCGR_PEP_ID=MMETSP0689_2-20121128/37819_1 /TAXON_ID=160604 /ORGANISM="Amphidinium massartii, Strain CS-259" /LENGTH=1090 /DNA_ID=CAMNT_0020065293 /DNA_START=9 /DNA_END=3281 /DNA_ORIENTATION=-